MTVTCAILMTEPSRGSVYFDSSPQGARIFIDGNDTLQYTPATVSDIVVGTHNFILTKAGYNNLTDTVDVLVNQTSTISATLIPSEGCIYFESTPAGAKIFIDDVNTTKITPDLVYGLSFGAHHYRLVLAGYQDTTGTVSLATGQGTIVTVVLYTPANVISATLTVDTNDCVAPCTVNGTVSWTNTGGSSGTLDPAILVNTVPTSLGTPVTINPGQTITYQFSLSLPPPLPPTADPYGGTPVGTVVCWNNPSIGANSFEGTIIYGFSQVRHSYGINFYRGYSGGIEVDDISHLFIGQCSLLPTDTYQICASPDSGTTCQTIIIRPANVISATLTVDTNDCVTPCTVNGTVSWTNTGGSPGTLDPAILVNMVPISLGTPVTIDPGQTLTYQFSSPLPPPLPPTIDPHGGTPVGTVVCWNNPSIGADNFEGTIMYWTGYAYAINFYKGYSGSIETRDFSYLFIGQCSLPTGTYQICASPDSGTACQIVIVRTPANIVTTAITPSVTTCIAPCNMTVDITWVNSGGTSGTFTPAIVIDGTSVPLATSETLDPTQSVTKTFAVTNLMKGSHTICASPDTGAACATITVVDVSDRGTLIEISRTATTIRSLDGATIDVASGYAYFGSDSDTKLTKFNLSTQSIESQIDVGDSITSSAIDTQGGYLYCGLRTLSQAIKVRLSDFTIESTINVSSPLRGLAAIDKQNGFIYFPSDGYPSGTIIKIRISDFTEVASLTLNAGERFLRSSVLLDTKRGYLYALTYETPAKVIRIRLSDFTEVDNITTSLAGIREGAVIDVNKGLLYAGSQADSPAKISKVNLESFAEEATITLGSGSGLECGVIDTNNNEAYFGLASGEIVKIDLATFTEIASISTGLDNFTAVIDTTDNFALFGTRTDNAYIIKINISKQQVVQAGFGAVGMFMVAGLAIGAIYAITKKPKTETTIK